MVEEVLVRESLSTQEIACGEELLSRVKKSGINVVAAYWVRDRTPDIGPWILDIVTPQVDKEGPRRVYEMIQKSVRFPSRIRCGLDINIITVLGTKYSFFKMLKTAIRSDGALSNIRLAQLVVGNSMFDLYIYRFPATNNRQ